MPRAVPAPSRPTPFRTGDRRVSEARVFTRRSVISLVAVGAISFGAAVYLALDGGSGHVALTPVAASFSKSAIGHHAFFEVLERAGVPVRIERAGTTGTAGGAGEADGAREADLALVLEPQPGRFNPYALDAALSVRTVLLVLPKWHGTSSSTAHPGWLGSVALHAIRKVDAIVQRADSEANTYRRHETQRFTDGRFGARPEIDRVQVLRGGTIRPIVASERGGILVGELRRGEHRLWIVSDPDLLNNHGISRGDNAVLEFSMASTISLVESRRPPGVSSRMTSMLAPSSVALAIARFTNLAAFGWMASSKSIRATWGSAANTAATPWETTAPPRPSTTRPTAIARLIAPATQLGAWRKEGNSLPDATLRVIVLPIYPACQGRACPHSAPMARQDQDTAAAPALALDDRRQALLLAHAGQPGDRAGVG